MDMADEVDVAGEFRQDTFATIGAVGSDEDFAVGKPRCGQGKQLAGQLGAGAMIDGGFALLGFLGVLW